MTRAAFLLPALLLTLSWAPPAAAVSGSIGYTEPIVAGVKARVVTVNLNDPDVRIGLVLGRNRVGSAEPFYSMVARAAPTAAITGTFFSTRSLLPTGDIVVSGELAWLGPVGTGIAFGPGNRVTFVDTKYGRQTDWSGYHTVLRGGPRLVRAGRKWLDPPAEGFRDAAHFRPALRTAVGVRKDGKLLMVAVLRPVSLSLLSRVMLALGAQEAVALDGGSSTGLYYRGSFIAQPKRSLTNVLIAYDSAVQYASASPRLSVVRSL